MRQLTTPVVRCVECPSHEDVPINREFKHFCKRLQRALTNEELVQVELGYFPDSCPLPEVKG